MAVENTLLAAHALGLGACVVKSFSRIALKGILELPERIEPELIVIIGHPKEQPKAPPKKENRRDSVFEQIRRKSRKRGALR